MCLPHGRDAQARSRMTSSLATVGRPIRSLAAASLIALPGCGVSPSVNILGSFFPAWLISIVIGGVLTVVVRQLFVAIDVASHLRPAGFALQRARADGAALDGEIAVTERRIEGQRFAVAAARATVQRMEAQLKNATDSLNRLQPLLSGEFVTPDKIDQARTAKLAAAAGLEEARQKMDQAEKDVGDLEALRAKRDAALAARGKAELDLGFCYVAAQFDALVVNLHTSIGAFVAPGPVPVFSLVDTRAWYVMADYRETELAHIAPGMEAEVYVLTAPRYRFRGRVQGIGWAVNPQDQPVLAGVPQIKRELNWVHIAQRFPVRIRVENPDPPDVFRVGASAVAIIRGWPADGAPGTPD